MHELVSIVVLSLPILIQFKAEIICFCISCSFILFLFFLFFILIFVSKLYFPIQFRRLIPSLPRCSWCWDLSGLSPGVAMRPGHARPTIDGGGPWPRRHASHVLLATPYGYRIAGSSVAHHPGPWRCGVGRWQQYLSGCPSPSSSCRVITSAHDAGGSAPLARGLLKAVMGRAPRGFAMFSLGHATWPGIFHHR